MRRGPCATHASHDAHLQDRACSRAAMDFETAPGLRPRPMAASLMEPVRATMRKITMCCSVNDSFSSCGSVDTLTCTHAGQRVGSILRPRCVLWPTVHFSRHVRTLRSVSVEAEVPSESWVTGMRHVRSVVSCLSTCNPEQDGIVKL